MRREDFETWLERFRQAWCDRDPDAAVALFARDATYRTSPFAHPLIGLTAIRAFWNDVPRQQSDVSVTTRCLLFDRTRGIGHFQADFLRAYDVRRVTIDGLILADFDDQGLCTTLHLWGDAKSWSAHGPMDRSRVDRI
jgi:hypothetical protein